MQQARQPKIRALRLSGISIFTSASGRNRRTAMHCTLDLTSNTALFLRDASTDRQRSWKRRLFTANTDGEGLVYDSMIRHPRKTYKPVKSTSPIKSFKRYRTNRLTRLWEDTCCTTSFYSQLTFRDTASPCSFSSRDCLCWRPDFRLKCRIKGSAPEQTNY